MRMPYNGEKRRLRRENPGAEQAAGAKEEDAEMAILHASIFSQALKRTVPIEVILPADKVVAYGQQREAKRFKTLYLLHGLLGSCEDWTRNTNIRQLAEERDLAVVMPSGENSFYVDQLLANNDYGVYVGQELVALTRRMFPLSEEREDTFIGGLSMGGFGALRNGLKYHETFGCIAALSAAVHVFEFAPEDPRREMLMGEDACFGDLKEAAKTDKNPRVAFLRILEEKRRDPAVELPRIYLACGTEDGLLEANRQLRDFFLANGQPVTYCEAPGRHDWAFWQDQIGRVLDWLPLGAGRAGISSGHVR